MQEATLAPQTAAAAPAPRCNHAMRLLLSCGTALMLAACAGTRSTPPAPPRPAPVATAPAAPTPEARPTPAPPPAPAPAPAAPKPLPLAAEQRWLEQLFEGTPVRISAESDGQALQLLVPIAFAFEADSPKPKPPLQAVLDRLGQSLKRQPASRLHISAPGPAARALAARSHLLTRGVAAHRVEAGNGRGNGEGVLLRLSLTAPALLPASASQ